jgi:hypothetical protein
MNGIKNEKLKIKNGKREVGSGYSGIPKAHKPEGRDRKHTNARWSGGF